MTDASSFGRCFLDRSIPRSTQSCIAEPTVENAENADNYIDTILGQAVKLSRTSTVATQRIQKDPIYMTDIASIEVYH